MDVFETVVAFVLEQEGGYVDDPRDPGGETKWGISKRSYPELAIADLTRDAAIAIYRRDFWEPHRFGELPPALALACFDAGVNQGPQRAVRWLQKALELDPDGVVGPETINRAMLAPLGATLRALTAERGFAYGCLGTFPAFGRTWMRRLLDCYRTALGLIGD